MVYWCITKATMIVEITVCSSWFSSVQTRDVLLSPWFAGVGLIGNNVKPDQLKLVKSDLVL